MGSSPACTAGSSTGLLVLRALMGSESRAGGWGDSELTCRRRTLTETALSSSSAPVPLKEESGSTAVRLRGDQAAMTPRMDRKDCVSLIAHRPAPSSSHSQDSPVDSETPARNRVTSTMAMPVEPKP